MSNYTLFTEILLDIVNYFWAPFCRTASNHNLLDFSLQSSWDYRHETLRSSLVCIYLITGEVEEIFMYWFSYLFNQLTFTTQVDMEARPRSASHCDFFFFFYKLSIKIQLSVYRRRMLWVCKFRLYVFMCYIANNRQTFFS
jgi:hypothetical protein